MDRQKYATNEDYRQGYDEGVKIGRWQIISEMETHVKYFNTCFEIMKDCEEGEEE